MPHGLEVERCPVEVGSVADQDFGADIAELVQLLEEAPRLAGTEAGHLGVEAAEPVAEETQRAVLVDDDAYDAVGPAILGCHTKLPSRGGTCCGPGRC